MTRSIMQHTYTIDDISKYNQDNNHVTAHPLISIINFSDANPRDWNGETSIQFKYGLYCVFLKDVKCGNIQYGRHYYDFQAGTLVFFAPGQIANYELPETKYQPKGYALVFHPDLIRGTSLSEKIHGFNFFSYKTNEALHISDSERKLILDCFDKVKSEINMPVDKHSKKLIVSNLELFFNYCERFYDRQFITREDVNQGLVADFQDLLNQYFISEHGADRSLPTVAYFADQLHLSANYFGDIIKKQTGSTAQDLIQAKVIEIAKERIYNNDKTISEIAYELGFKYPQHFTRLFKQHVGVPPSEFRTLN